MKPIYQSATNYFAKAQTVSDARQESGIIVDEAQSILDSIEK